MLFDERVRPADLTSGYGTTASGVPQRVEQCMQPHAELVLHESVQDGCCTLALAGELDLATAVRFEEAIGRICADGASELVLDLSELSFIDSCGLSALLRARADCEQRRCRLLLTNGRPQIKRLFALTGAASRLRFLA